MRYPYLLVKVDMELVNSHQQKQIYQMLLLNRMKTFIVQSYPLDKQKNQFGISLPYPPQENAHFHSNKTAMTSQVIQLDSQCT